MGHKYIKEDDIFSTSRNGTVPKPTQQDVSDDKVLHADGSWGTGGGSGGSSTLDGLDDVDISSPSDGQGLFYDSTEQKWKNADPPSGGGDVTDVLQDGQSVVDENGVARITTPSVPSNLNDLSDVNTSNPTTDDYLGYDQQTGKWINKPVSGGGSGNVDDVEVNGVSVVDQNKIAKIKSYKEVTQAEYNALPDSKTSDGILYCITDAPSGAEGFPPVIYSDEERQIGVWRNGKPLYQKTYHITPTTSDIMIPITSLNIDKTCDLKGVWKRVGNNRDYPLFPRTESNSYPGYGIRMWVDYDSNILDIIIDGYGYSSISSIDATIQYTKTTDVAGSGKWNTDGTPSHHYSETEHVIGTWIDGKPLYEKVFVKGNVEIYSGYSFAHGISNLELVVDLRVFMKNSAQYADNLFVPINADMSASIGFRANATYIKATGNNSFGALSDRYWYFIIQYTKTTD